MTTLCRLFLLGAVVLVAGCASDYVYSEHQTRVPMLPTGARVLVNADGVKMYEYQGLMYRQLVNGNGWEVVPNWSAQSTTTTTVSGDGKTIIRN